MAIIAVAGMPGSGKSYLVSLFAQKGYSIVRFGDLTEEELRKRNLPQTPQTEENIREELRRQYSMSAYAKLNLPRIESALKKGNVVIDGLYSWEEYLFLKEQFGEKILVVAIYSSPKTRYRRLADRNVRPLTYEEAKKRDHSEIEKLSKAEPIAMADYTITNEGTLIDLKNEFEKVYNLISNNNNA
jgi:dephospho-CoA kinase